MSGRRGAGWGASSCRAFESPLPARHNLTLLDNETLLYLTLKHNLLKQTFVLLLKIEA